MNKFECHEVILRLGEKEVLSNFTFSFNGPGMILIEGDNGVGKSSALKTFAGFIIPTNGTILFDDHSVDQIGASAFSFFTTTSLGLLSELTGIDHIHIISKSLGIKNDVVLRKIESFKTIAIFNEILNKKVGDYSQGMKQLLRLFLHLFFEPKVIFLDEPFLYLSPNLREFIQAQIEHLASNSLVFITDQKFTWEPKVKTSKIVLGAT